MKKFINLILFLFLIVSLNSCISYKGTQSQKSINEISTDDYEFFEFVDNIDFNKKYLKNKNKLLYLLEKGKIEHYNGNFEKSNEYFEDAYFMIENEALNSKSGKVFSYITNGEASDYRAEDFEKTALLYYKALNFFQLGDYDSALVEAKRINIKLNALNSNYKEGKNRYSEDAFSQILMGIIYEAKKDFNNAFIAYRNAVDIYLKNDNSYFETELPQQLKLDVIRTAKILNFSEEAARYQRIFNLENVKIDTKKRQAIVFWENGLGPYKGQTKISAGAVDGIAGGSFENEEMGIVIPIPADLGITGFTALAIPKYLERQPYYNSAEIENNGKIIPLEPVENYSAIAKQCLKDRMGREVIQSVARMATKAGIAKGAGFGLRLLGLDSTLSNVAEAAIGLAGVLIEKADLRNWNSLPNTINYARFDIEDNQNEVTLRLKTDTQVDEINLKLNDTDNIQVFNQISFTKVYNSNNTISSTFNKSIPSNEITTTSGEILSSNKTSTTTNNEDINKLTEDAILQSMELLFNQSKKKKKNRR